MSEKIFWYICERNNSSKCLATQFSAARGPIGGGRDCEHTCRRKARYWRDMNPKVKLLTDALLVE
jgi:hypothetical protein